MATTTVERRLRDRAIVMLPHELAAELAAAELAAAELAADQVGLG